MVSPPQGVSRSDFIKERYSHFFPKYVLFKGWLAKTPSEFSCFVEGQITAFFHKYNFKLTFLENCR